MRVAEEEDRRLLMPASGCSFRFMVDVERLSTRREVVQMERQTREAGFTLEVSQGEEEEAEEAEEGVWEIRLGCSVGKMCLYGEYFNTPKTK